MFQPISIYPSCTNDISFWLPEDGNYSPNDFYDIVREIGGDVIDQIILKDKFVHPETRRTSHCYTIVYRHMERTLTKREVNVLHHRVARAMTDKLNVIIR